MILTVLSYGYETDLLFETEHGLMVSENRVLRRIYGPKGEEVTGRRRKLHKEEMHNLYSLPNIVLLNSSGRMRWAKQTKWMGK
jgi:hypothetical protein